MKILLLLCIVASFLSTLIVTPYWIKRAKRAGLVGRDMNKFRKTEIAEVGGICVVAGFLAGVLFYIAIKTFYFTSLQYVIEILAVVASILIITLIGFIDDILGWKIGLRQYQKPILCLLAGIPLAVINAGYSTISLPFIDRLNIGLLYPLLIIPIAISAAANGFNMLAGFNGLEAGMGAIILTILGILAWGNNSWVTLIAFCAVAALIAFLFYNKFPAKVFPGNTLTYIIGALIAAVAILGNVEKAALILFIPYFLELFLKARGKLRIESFALAKRDGSLRLRKGIYGTGHLAIALLNRIKPSHKVYETDVVNLILIVEAAIGLAVLIIFI